MAFLQHQPSRRNVNRELDGIRSDERIGTNSNRSTGLQQNQRETSIDDRAKDSLGTSRIRANVNADDWSIVFPGKARNTVSPSIQRQATHSSRNNSSSSVSPNEEVELDLTLPPAHDGTGNFTRPSSPSYHADDEHDRASLSPESGIVWGAPPSDIVTSDLFTDDELDLLDEAEVSSSVLISDSESLNVSRRRSTSQNRSREERQSSTSISARQLQKASRLNQIGSSTLASSSWSWMNAAQSQQKSTGKQVRNPNTRLQIVPAILTSESEGEEKEDRKLDRLTRQARKIKEDAAFEEALGTAHQAYSAGLYPRVPKRRHRKNGESEKGSKRSNNSAAVASELLSAHRRRNAVGRKSQTSAASMRSRSQVGSSVNRIRTKTDQNRKDGTIYTPESSSRTERLLSAIFQRVFGVEDEEVLKSFFRDEGPLRVEDDEKERATNAAIASRAPISNGMDDDVWSRNRRQHHMRLLLDGRSVPEEVEEIDSGSEADEDQKSNKGKSRTRSYSGHPNRTYVTGNVAEPSLPEALHATLLSGLRSVPSSLSLFLAGSNSVRFVNYLVGRIGPSFTERMRKLIDDASVDEDSNAEIADLTGQSPDIITRVLRSQSNSGSLSDLGSWEGVDVSSLRFKGDKHPAIASSSSRSNRSSSQNTVPGTKM